MACNIVAMGLGTRLSILPSPFKKIGESSFFRSLTLTASHGQRARKLSSAFHLPHDVLVEICSYLGLQDVISFSKVRADIAYHPEVLLILLSH